MHLILPGDRFEQRFSRCRCSAPLPLPAVCWSLASANLSLILSRLICAEGDVKFTNVFVKNLPDSINEGKLRELCEAHGEVCPARQPRPCSPTL